MSIRETCAAALSETRLVAAAETLSRNAISLAVTQQRPVRPARAAVKNTAQQDHALCRGVAVAMVPVVERVETGRGVDTVVGRMGTEYAGVRKVQQRASAKHR